MKSKFQFSREGFIQRMKMHPSSHGHKGNGNPNELPLTKGNITLLNSEGRVMQVMPFRSRNERKELFKRANNIKGVTSISLVFYSH